ncbi:uncharacterized protein ARMOST_04391 [Armillaria ostoyae]|uniref:DUF6534 domain-containing protein n=1 Tax=Armillaria ostoyae TaxID=47428 RepID=A0A284QXB0_ARMOS|nr:uncharacterized protein ARMOST_04391 [Armillaria ostoyae]
MALVNAPHSDGIQGLSFSRPWSIKLPSAMLLRSTDTWIMSQTVQLVDDFRYRSSVPSLLKIPELTSVQGLTIFTHLCEARSPFPFPQTEQSPSGFGLETVGQIFVRKEFSMINEVFVSSPLLTITAILSDLLIALGLCLLLQRSRTNFANTNYIIKTLVGYAITRCLLTSIMTVVEVVLIAQPQTPFYSFAVDFVIGKLWSNSLLASLNSRRSLRDTFNRRNSGSMSTSFRVGSPVLTTTGTEPGQISVVRISGQGESKSPDEKSGGPTVSSWYTYPTQWISNVFGQKISTQASRQSSEVRFSVVDAQQTK